MPLPARLLPLFGLFLAISAPGTAFAAENVIAATDAEGFAALVRETGAATVERNADGGTFIATSLDQVPYQIFFLPCEPAGDSCTELNFYAGFAGVKPPLDAINEWNRAHRFGRAYLDRDLDAALEMDLGVEGGISPGSFRAALAIWDRTLKAFIETVAAAP